MLFIFSLLVRLGEGGITYFTIASATKFSYLSQTQSLFAFQMLQLDYRWKPVDGQPVWYSS